VLIELRGLKVVILEGIPPNVSGISVANQLGR
jgi:hypothetical protein